VNRFPKIRFRLAVLAVSAAAVALVALAAVSVIQIIRGDTHALGDPPVHAQSVKAGFAILSRRHSNQCGLRPESLDSIATNGRLQGSCCSPMRFSHYLNQLSGLAQYASMREIPQDPYDVSVRLAKRLTSYSDHIKLTPRQQTTYDEAVRLADEHGPCCCHCWRWTAFEGQAKYLIARRGYGSHQIANVWDLEDGCGGQ
jgi:hypothetical protein